MTDLVGSWSALLISWGWTLLKIVAIVILGWLAIRLAVGVVRNVFARRDEKVDRAFRLDERRAKTLVAVLTSLIRYVIDFTVAVTILAALNINTSTILVGAGVASLAVGFGAQSLVKDVITGFFILFEDQFSVGDYVTAAGLSGVVEEVGLRATKLRDFSGEVHNVPNGIIDKTTNHSRKSSRALITVTVPYDEAVERVQRVLSGVAERVAQEFSSAIVEKPRVLGITAFTDIGVQFTVIGQTVPMEQWGVERALRLGVKRAFEQEGIRIAALLGPAASATVAAAAGRASTEGK